MLAFLIAALGVTPQRPISLQNGTVITRSVRVAPKIYRFTSVQGEEPAGDERIPTFTPAIVVRGDGITVDFCGATLQGTPETTEPDQRKGLAVLVRGRNVTIRHLNAHGYKVGLMARSCPGLKVVDCDFSYNWKQHLASTVEREDLSDWQSYHHNEHDEWLRYGAAIYLSGCENFEVRNVRATGGQCGLMLNRCNHGKVFGNDFSFLSGEGLGMYRSSDNLVAYNKMDWCVRGFSYGVYNRGQDSAGILVFEQCCRNVFAYNSATHGGDGFFLWAGQQTMDTGQGGCNDNVVVGNDFSHSPANAIEATFSRNVFAHNLLLDSWHGVWGGYSYDTTIEDNVFGYDGQAIAIEHGQNNEIVHNDFFAMTDAIDIWAEQNNDPNFAYGRNHDILSHDYRVSRNGFQGIYGSAIRVRDSKNVLIEHNWSDLVKRFFLSTYSADELKDRGMSVGANDGEPWWYGQHDGGPSWMTRPSPDSLDPSGKPIQPNRAAVAEYVLRFEARGDPYVLSNLRPVTRRLVDRTESRLPPPSNFAPQFMPLGTLRGQRYILVDEWGPYDFRRPLLWPRLTTGTHVKFEILGPKGRWRLLAKEGINHVSAQSGTVPGWVEADLAGSAAGTTKLELQFVGASTTDYRGILTPAGRPVVFEYLKFHAPIDWHVKFFRWTESENPADPHAAPKDFAKVLAGTPIKELDTDNLDYAGGALVPGLPDNHYGTLATGTFTVPAGPYKFELTTDDGARVWLDGAPLIEDAWHYQGPTLYARILHLPPGKHTLRVEHFQIDGYAALKLTFRPSQ